VAVTRVIHFLVEKSNYPGAYAEFSLPKYTINWSSRFCMALDKMTVSLSLPKFDTTMYDSCPISDLK